MTREQAEIVLHSIKFILDNAQYSDDVEEALNIAIESLKNSERTEKFSQNVSNGDFISRKAAIDVLNEMKIYRPLDSDRWVISDCLNKIVNLPSVHPKFPENWWKTDHGYMWLCPHCGLPVHSDFDECLRCGIKRPSAQPDWNEMIVICDCCGHAIHVQRQ